MNKKLTIKEKIYEKKLMNEQLRKLRLNKPQLIDKIDVL